MKITDLEPKLIWECFDQITKIPRPTHHLDRMREFLVSWAESHNLAVATDAVGNVVIRKPATPGHENAPTVILQGHQDMVAEKLPSKQHDFLTDPITTIVDGEWVRADGTTLGADNGMGCAAAMAVLIDENLEHGPLECLFTVDEEQGLIGANGLQPGFVTGNILLNLDSEEMGQLVIGCAGGKITDIRVPYQKVPATAGLIYYKVEIGGLKGGHSGMEINLGRGNANQQLARFLFECSQEFAFEMVEIDGGNLANAIPRDAWAVIGVAADDVPVLARLAMQYNEQMHAEFKGVENPEFMLSLDQTENRDTVIDSLTAHNLIKALFACPNGVQGMSHAIEGLVETSCNLASVKMKEPGMIDVTVHQRSSVDSRRDEIADRIKALFMLIGATVSFSDAYVGWAPNPDSEILRIATESYRDIFHTEPKVEALHAGLECGLFLEKMPALDMVSFGPTLKDIHSPAEKANIQSVADFWKLLTEILRRLA